VHAREIADFAVRQRARAAIRVLLQATELIC
jgi:hypothetical protein